MRDAYCLEPVGNAFWFMTQTQNYLVQKAGKLEVFL